MKKLLAKFTALSMVAAGVVVMPSSSDAAALSNLSDTMTRVASGATAVHSIEFTAPTNIPVGSKIRLIDNSGAGWLANGAGAATFDGLNVGISDDGVWTEDLAFDTENGSGLTAATTAGIIAAGSVVTMTGLTATNPGTAGSYAFTLQVDLNGDGSYEDVGAFAVVIADGSDPANTDQVVVTATVDPTITFTVSGSSIAMGSLAADGSETDSGTGTHLIATSNASNGLVVTAKGTYGGLYSATANGGSGYTITGDLDGNAAAANQTDGFGLLVQDNGTTFHSTAGGALTTYNTDGASNRMTVSTAAKPVASVNKGPFSLNVGVSYLAEIATANGTDGITPAASDYTETITYVATGTF